MTDLEITRLCAEAMKYSNLSDHLGGLPVFTSETGVYDPLHDDAQAMALVKKFHIHLDKTLRTPDDPKGLWIASNTDKWTSEPTADLNRAICECVARVQKGKP